jgi:kinesin family protein 5
MQGQLDNPEKEGIIPRIIRSVFCHMFNSSEDIEYTVKASMIEIYMEKIKDLVDPTKVNLNVREDKQKGIYIEDLTEHYCSNEEEVLDIMKVGADNRAIAATNMNENSSRSHSIFIMQIHQFNIKDSIAKVGKLYLVDLAGSEKISKTGATGATLDEGKNINLSLTSLGMVINSLTDGKSNHIPYRNSKLTRVLQESLGGNAKTCLIITASPSNYNEQETLSTLRFGERAKRIKNKPKINKEVTVAELKAQVEKLETMLHGCAKRIDQLESFISKNNLKVPEEGDYSFMNKSEEVEETQTETVDENNNLQNKVEDNITSILLEQERKLQEHVFREKMANMLEENNNLNDQLEDAIKRLDELKGDVEEREMIHKELEEVRKTFELKEYELQEKVCELQEKLDLQNNAVGRVHPNMEEICTEIDSVVSICDANGTNSEEADEKSIVTKLSGIFNLIKAKMISKGNSNINNILKSLLFESLALSDSTVSGKTNTDSFKDEIAKRESKKYEQEKQLVLKTLQEKEHNVISF